MSKAANMVRRLKRRGFDKSHSLDGQVRIRCSQCEALAIQGVACHERGCPNDPERR